MYFSLHNIPEIGIAENIQSRTKILQDITWKPNQNVGPLDGSALTYHFEIMFLNFPNYGQEWRLQTIRGRHSCHTHFPTKSSPKKSKVYYKHYNLEFSFLFKEFFIISHFNKTDKQRTHNTTAIQRLTLHYPVLTE